MQVAVRAQLHRGLVGQQAVLAHQAQGTAVLTRAAGVGQEGIGLDAQRPFGLYHFHRRVGQVADAVGPAVLPVAVRSAALAGGVVELEMQEGFVVLLEPGENNAELGAAGAGRDAVGHPLGHRAEYHRADAESRLAARAGGGRELRVDEAARWGGDGDGSVEAGIVWNVRVHDRAQSRIGARGGEGQIRLQRALALR